MEIWHKITFAGDSEIESILMTLAVKYEKTLLPGQAYLIHVNMPETADAWSKVADLAVSKQAVDIFNTVFSHQEIQNAEWVRVCPSLERGYPEPYNNGAWKRLTLSGVCVECGAGYTQLHPFQTKKEPKLGNHHFFSLVATQALFSTRQVVDRLQGFHFSGLSFEPLNVTMATRILDKFFQLKVKEIAKPGLVGHTVEGVCSTCKTIKYLPHMKGYMELRQEAVRESYDVMFTYEWFGSGHAAYREIIISHRFAQVFLNENWRGINLKPVRLV